MKITLIGSGNVAYHLAKMMSEYQLPLVQVFGRNEKDLREISEKTHIHYSTEQLADADIYIISVKDNAVEEVSQLIQNPNALVVHTSGSLPLSTLKGDYRKGVLYPLQTFSKFQLLDYSKIPFFIETEQEKDAQILTAMMHRISDKVMIADSIKRKYIHLSAVFSCNFVNHLFSIAKEISDAQQIPFEYFLPLIDETVKKIHTHEPKLAQTGPAVRNDQKIIRLHREIISSPKYLEIYNSINQSIIEMYHAE